MTADRSHRRSSCVSYPLHHRQRNETKAHRGPVHSIRSSQSRRLQVIPVTARLPACPIPSLSVLRQIARRKHRQHPADTFTIKQLGTSWTISHNKYTFKFLSTLLFNAHLPIFTISSIFHSFSWTNYMFVECYNFYKKITCCLSNTKHIAILPDNLAFVCLSV